MARFELTSQKGLIICYARLAGKGEPILLKMALDTGATTTIIPPEIALGIGVNPAHSEKTIEITTGSGTVICPIGTIPKFACLGFTFKNLDVVCHDLPSESPVEGLLGLNFLKKTGKVILDFHHGVIEVIE